VTIDKYEVLGEPRGRARYQWTVRVDVAYLKGLEVVGIGEVIAPDQIHGVPGSEVSGPPWITPGHKIEHLVRDRRLEFLIVLNVMNRYPPVGSCKKTYVRRVGGALEELYQGCMRAGEDRVSTCHHEECKRH